MKKITMLIAVLTLLLTATLLTTTATAQEKEVVVSIPDANLAAAIRETLGLPPAQQFTADAMRNLTRLNASSRGIADLTGLEYAVNLTALDLEGTNVSDVSALASLTNLRMLYLGRTGVSDVSALANLTNLVVLFLTNTDVSDVSALAGLINLAKLDLWGCPLNSAAHHTDIPAIRANGTEVKFRLPNVHVSLIYFRPSDKPVRPNVDAEIDALIKEAQRFYADEMERHGFGRKTFQFEADANGNAVVHHVNGKFTEAHYKQGVNERWIVETREQIRMPQPNITVYMLEVEGASTGGGNPFIGGRANIKDHWGWHTIAHELGHAFGMLYHDHRALSLMSYQGFNGSLSPCFAAWLDVHPAFNPTVVRRDTRATVEMLPPTLAAPPNAIRLRFTVTAPAGSLYQARLLTREKTLHPIYHNSGGLIGCKRIDGNPTSSTVEFVTALTPDTKSVTLQIIGIDGDIDGLGVFPIDVASLLPPAKVVSIPDPNLAAAVREALNLSAGETFTTHSILNLVGLDARGRGIADLTGLEYAVNLIKLDLHSGPNPISNLSPLASLTNLRSLVLLNTAVSDVSPLANLTQLTRLWLNETAVSDVSPLARLTNLDSLRLTGTGVSDVSALASLTNLRWLSLSNTDVSDVSPFLGLSLPVLGNTGKRTGGLSFEGCPLSYASIHTHIPALQAKGIEVEFDNAAHRALFKASGDRQEAGKLPTRWAAIKLKASGVRQEGGGATALPTSFVVEAMNKHGWPLVNWTVQFDILEGGGRLSAKTVKTDTRGKARVTLTLGKSQGVNKVRASAKGIQSWVLFTAVATEDAPPLVGDVNGDGMVDQADLAIVEQAMGKPVENPRADVNADGVVDGEDFALVAANLGEGEAVAPSQAALPAGLTLEKVEWALNLLHAENTGSPAFRRGIAKLEGFLALLVPDKTLLLANYPNPFNPETWIPYQLSKSAEVTVTIYAANGAVVRMLALGHRRAGSYASRHRAAYWDGRNAQGEPVASGVYFYTLSAGDFKATRKMVIRK